MPCFFPYWPFIGRFKPKTFKGNVRNYFTLKSKQTNKQTKSFKNCVTKCGDSLVILYNLLLEAPYILNANLHKNLHIYFCKYFCPTLAINCIIQYKIEPLRNEQMWEFGLHACLVSGDYTNVKVTLISNFCFRKKRHI